MSLPPSTQRSDVIIIGAGPAGCAAAITLARSGRSVTVLDKATFPRDKICGDGLTSGCLRLLEDLGFDPAPVASFTTIDDVFLSPPGSKPIPFPLPQGKGVFAAAAKRAELDNALVELARGTGVNVLDGHACSDIKISADHVDVRSGDAGRFRADWLIAADGMWSPTRKLLGLTDPGYRGEWHAFRQYFANVGPRAAEELHVWFEPDILPGYVWSFPLSGGRANIGFGLLREVHDIGSMGKYWPALLERPHIRAIVGDDLAPEGPHRAWPIPARLGDRDLTAPRTFFVGDAAAACDPMTGEGIGQALETGMASAESILAADPNRPEEALAQYRTTIGNGLEVDMRFAAQLGNLLGNPTVATASLRLAGLTAWTRRNFARWLFEDYPRAILGTPRRWKTDTFTRPGSFID